MLHIWKVLSTIVVWLVLMAGLAFVAVLLVHAIVAPPF
jgi:hypothetical protein